MAGQFIESQLSIKFPKIIWKVENVLHLSYIYGFRECDSINSKENIQAGYRNGSRIVNW